MDESDDSSSEQYGVPLLVEDHEIDELSIPPNEVVDDLTGEIDDLVNKNESLASLSLSDGVSVVKPRTYQLEMLDKSLKQNIIIAMDTGSGKTHIAVMRMLHELENSPPHKLIWFVAPTVSLCSQQFEYIQSQMTSIQVKFLSGADNIERWTNQIHWDEVLKNVKIVVSPYQILYEALSHGFVQIDSLSMIVFDEAHNCVGKHPGALLMKNFYHGRKVQGDDVPKILGLTASPVMRSNPLSVSNIEQTLDAICRTPKKHRAELRLYVKLPALITLQFDSPPLSFTTSVKSLAQSFRGLDLTEDPYYLSLRRDKSERAQRSMQKLIINNKTWSRDQIKSFYIISQRINEELGDWAADYYVSHVVSKVTNMVDRADDLIGIWNVSNAEKQYVARVLRQVKATENLTENGQFSVTNKVTKLIEVLLGESGQSSGIVFVKERATASMLAKLLRTHPQTCDKFKVGTVVGTSQHSKRTQSIGELLDAESSEDALSMFRAGKLDIVIATSVLEEGLDVPGCNLVVCFEKPANLKSFVQRRGRARHQDSKLILLLDSKDPKLREWAQLEADMKAIYENEMRILKEMLVEEDSEEHDGRVFRVERTNATLDLDSSVAHLHHFCAVLPAKDYVDLRPDFICTQENNGQIRTKVILPISVHEAVRGAESQRAWGSEKNAIKDAAFQAYVALYHAGLVNDNLLPLLKRDEVVDEMMTSAVETRASIMEVNQQLNPWIEIASAWEAGAECFQSQITLGSLPIQICLPTEIPRVQPFKVFWDANTELIVTPSRGSPADPEMLANAENDTWALLQAAFSTRFSVERKQVVMQFSVCHDLPLLCLLGQKPATSQGPLSGASGLIREKLESNVAYIFQQILPTKPPIRDVQHPCADYESVPVDAPHFAVKRLHRRLDLLHKLSLNDQPTSTKPYSVVLPVSRCTIDEMPFPLVQFGLLIPSIMRRYEVYLIAQCLSSSLLKDVQISDLSLVVTAICASSACEETNYQRLEFLGDSILKMCTSVQLIASYPLWHEGYLSYKKDRLVANSRLARVAVDVGLDRFIITKSFTGLKWRPPYVANLVKMVNDGKRQMSSKVLADVVEALIGAAMVDGGLPMALRCLTIFLPELDWEPLSNRRDFLYHRSPDTDLPSTLAPLEELIGYKFSKKALLIEAMTHASYNSGSSLERFEFLGDSILDYIVVTEMYKHNLSHVQMHLLRTALVNADFLAFVCMEWCTSQEVITLASPSNPSVPITKTISVAELPLWRFMRHTSPSLAAVQAATVKRHAELRVNLKESIEHGNHYPWALLARLQAQKFYSDLVESLLGAVWIDSGSFEVCREMIEEMGILGYMRRILREGVHVWHPKEELGVFANTEKVKYVLEKGQVSAAVEVRESGRGGEYACTIFVGEREVVRVDGGVSKEEVKTRAAERAVEILREEGVKGLEKDKGSMGGMSRKWRMGGTTGLEDLDVDAGVEVDSRQGGVDLIMDGC